MNSLASDVANTLGGVFALREDAFTGALALPYVGVLAAAVGLLAGFSEALAQSVVLFANRVPPLRFVFSLAVNGLLFAFGYAFLTVTTWAIMELPRHRHVPIIELAIVFALSYAPMLLAFLGALPYLGVNVLWAVRVWHLLALVVGVAAIAGTTPFDALTDVGLGWVALAIGQQTCGRPVARCAAWLLDTVAGVALSDEAIAVRGMLPGSAPVTQSGGATAATASASLTATPRAHSSVWLVALAALAVLMLGYVVSLTLTPVRGVLLGWDHHLPVALRLPFDLTWIALVGAIVAGFIAPLETLGWWAGWYGGGLTTTDPVPDAPGAASESEAKRYIVYLDGISQSSSKYTFDIETFLDALTPRLPSDVQLVRGLMVYSVLNRPLDDDPILSRFWSLVDTLRFKDPSSLIGMIVNLRNVLIVGVSADQRYGPMYNFGIAQLVYDGLIGAGYKPRSGTPVTLIGYSGGGQMAAATGGLLRRALDAPIEVISLGGVISGTCPLLELEHLYHCHGTKDNVERLGPIMFPSRWRIAVLSSWNRALRLGRISLISLGPVGHQVPGGMLDPNLKLPDGRTALEQTLDDIELVLAGRIEPGIPPNPIMPTRYEQLHDARAAFTHDVRVPLTRAGTASIPDPERFAPAGEWTGRLILPEREERTRVRGVWFEVRHAPQPCAHLAGTRIALRWNDEPDVAEFLRALASDVRFSARAAHSSRHAGLVLPCRIDGWRLVDPLESLAGAHPYDDVEVALPNTTRFEDGPEPALRIGPTPLQVAAPYYTLVRFVAPAGDGAYEAVHYGRATHAFDGPRERMRVPARASGLEHDPFNAMGWYAFGDLDPAGAFAIRALAPRALLNPPPEAALGERALLVHTRGAQGANAKYGFGFAEVVADALSGEPRFEVEYELVAQHDPLGTISGSVHWSRCIGDLWLGFGGRLPVRDALYCAALDPATLEAIRRQLAVMAARYRSGDGSGASYDGEMNGAARDALRALLAGLDESPANAALVRRLRRTFQLLGAPQFERSTNRYDIGNGWTDAPFEQLRAFAGGWRAWRAPSAAAGFERVLGPQAASLWPFETAPERRQYPAVDPAKRTTA